MNICKHACPVEVKLQSKVQQSKLFTVTIHDTASVNLATS